MRILVTGRDGQVASCLAQLGQAHELIFASRPDLDLADANSIERVISAAKPDLVLSVAAYTAVDLAEDEPELAMLVNGVAPGIIGRAAANCGAPVIHLSTDYVFDGTLERPWVEQDNIGPIGVYGASKLAGERSLAQSGARYVILRTSWVYSPFGSNFVKTMLRLANTRDRVAVVADQFGCPTSAYDIVEGVRHVLDLWAGPELTGADAVYHLAGSGDTCWAEFADAIFAESKARGGPHASVDPIASSSYPTKAKRPANSRLNSAAFAARFGYAMPEWRKSLGVVIDQLLC